MESHYPPVLVGNGQNAVTRWSFLFVNVCVCRLFCFFKTGMWCGFFLSERVVLTVSAIVFF